MIRKNVIITGSTGMIGSIVLRRCLEREDVALVTIINRKKSGIVHPKLKEYVHSDFTNFDTIKDVFSEQDICFYCLGVYTGAVDREEFRKITYDYNVAFARTLKSQSPGAKFCLLSGQGADNTEKSNLMFARDKGAAENEMMKLGFGRLHIFRPGYIYPDAKRKDPNMVYSLMRLLYKPILSWLVPNMGIRSEELSDVMIKVAFVEGQKTIYENADIRALR
jgi:uncharacterized protein YbjT (DUF2867 family)